MDEPNKRPIVRDAISILFIGTLWGVWLYGRLYKPKIASNQTVLYSLLDIVFMVFIFASALVLYGPEMIGRALELVERIKGE